MRWNIIGPLTLFAIGLVRGQIDPIGNCTFTQDCQEHEYCKGIQDASCVCNHGECIINGIGFGGFFTRGSQCENFTDCPCRDNPDRCYCEAGFCTENNWECHDSSDCLKFEKCNGLNCTCEGFRCENQCTVDADCEDFHCNDVLGYQCRCDGSMCQFEQKPTECKTISDCVDKELCSADKPCDCVQEFCTLPWWLKSKEDELNCRTDQECERILLECEGEKCSCSNMVRYNDWERRGTCTVRKERIPGKENIRFPSLEPDLTRPNEDVREAVRIDEEKKDSGIVFQ